LDVCCGEGATVELLLRLGFDVRGVDLAPREDGLPVARGSAYELTCETSSLDGILCECGLSLLEADDALSEFARALRPGGRLLLSDVYSRARGGRVRGVRVLTQEELEALLARHGFELLLFEDQGYALASFLAQQILEGGSRGVFDDWTADRETKSLSCGYFMCLSKLLTEVSR
jgi:SAM-dependent methyltransferase